MSKFELRRRLEVNGDVFYQVFKDDDFVSGSTVFAGNNPSEKEIEEAIRRAMTIFDNAIETCGGAVETTILTKEV